MFLEGKYSMVYPQKKRVLVIGHEVCKSRGRKASIHQHESKIF